MRSTGWKPYRLLGLTTILSAWAVSGAVPVVALEVEADFNTAGELAHKFNLNRVSGSATYSEAQGVGVGGTGGVAVSPVTIDTDTTAVYKTQSFSFASGDWLTASAFAKRVDATGWVNFLQVGFTGENTWQFRISGYDTSENRYFVSLRLSPDSDSADVINFQMQQRYGTASQVQTYYYPGITRTLTEGNWYKLTGEFKNTNAGTQVTVRGAFDDWGPSGTALVSRLWTYPEWTFPMPNPIASDDTVWAGFRAVNQSGAIAVDNFSASGPASPPPPPVTHVLCVGVRDNANNIFGDVAAQRVRDAFAKFPSVKTAWCLPLYQNNTLIDNREAFATMLNRMKDRVQPGDSFVLYFASHGTFEWLGDELPVEAQFSTKFPNLRIPPTSGDEWLYLSSVDKSQNISDDDLRSMFLGLSWEQMNKLFIIDCCYSGGFMGNTTNGDTGDLTTLSKAAVLAAAPEWDFAYAGWDDDADGYVNNLGKAVTCALDALQGLDSVTWFDLLSRTRLEGRRFEGSNSRILDFEDNWGTDLSAVFSPVDWSSSDFEFIFGIPEPATLSLLALGGLALLHRRRGASS